MNATCRKWIGSLLLCGCTSVMLAVPAARAGEDTPPPGIVATLRQALDGTMDEVRKSRPEWVRHRSGDELVETSMAADARDLCLVLQEGRPDGTDLLTARLTLLDLGRIRTFAGAGLNRTTYFYDDPAVPGPSRLDRHNRDQDFGAAAELGAEMWVSRRVHLSAELRWIELHDRALVLRSEDGPVKAEPLTFGLAVSYRFR